MSFEKTLLRKSTLAAEGGRIPPQKHRVRRELALFFVYREIPIDENRLSSNIRYGGFLHSEIQKISRMEEPWSAIILA
jgi:hypothetical protein